MKNRKLAGILLLAMFAAAPLWAMQQVSAEDYDAAMKSIRGALGGVGDQMTAEDAEGLGAAGETFVDSFLMVEAYWTDREEEAAVELAAKALAEARKFQEAGAAGNFEAAGMAFAELRTTCQPCHEGYRERDADGNWQIKAGGGR